MRISTPSASPQPLQIISTGGTNSSAFSYNEANLKIILDKITDKKMKVAILSVVGGFRSGKSFLLNFFLRYLRSSSNDQSLDWINAEGDVLLQPVPVPQPDIALSTNGEDWEHVDGKSGTSTPPNVATTPAVNNNFVWRGGKERQTTGVWIWSEPFIRESAGSNGEKIALLLMDTQGIFDNETPMRVTAQIFGLSTLVSSFQIYNVDKLISEDKLQHLALFSEYGRLALEPVTKRKADQPPPPPPADSADEAAPLLPPQPPSQEEEEQAEAQAQAQQQGDDEAVGAEEQKAAAAEPPTTAPRPKPFQVMQFLVRDYQNFEQEIELSENGSLCDAGFAELRVEMEKYIGEVMQVRDADLQQTRDQILKCFGKVDCFLLPHPGLAITKPTYAGEISKIDKTFLAVLDRYVRSIFEQEIQAKTINGHFINAADLLTFFDVYSTCFERGGDGKTGFPEPVNILEATARANNRSSYDRALEGYTAGMEAIVGHEKEYYRESALEEKHQQLVGEATSLFDSRATMGAEEDILTTRTALLEKIGSEYRRYQESNSLRNPFKDMEIYMAAVIVAAMSWLLATIVDSVCSTDMCEHTEKTFVRVYCFILLALIFFLWKQISKALTVGYELLRPFIGAQLDATLAELRGKVKLS